MRIKIRKRIIISFLLTILSTVLFAIIIRNENLLILLSVLIISFLFFYKITDYIADFKSVKNYSKIDIIFLVIFFILLFIPISNIDKSEKSTNENRNLSKKTTLFKNKNLNLNFGQEFNNYFNDRFTFRNNLIKLNIILNCTINQNYCSNRRVTYYKKENLLYREGYYGLPEITKDKEEILAYFAKNLNEFQKYCNKKNIKLYLLVVPRQAEFFDYKLKDTQLNKPDQAEEILNYLYKNTKTIIIYPKQEMLEANKETPVYFKTDHHWTKKGAYVGYCALIKKIQKDFFDVPLLKEDSLIKYYDNRVSEHWNKSFNNGQSFKHLGLPTKYARKILDTPYLYYKNPNKEKLQTDVKLAPILKIGYIKKQDNQFYYPDGANRKIMIIGNSFAANLVEFLPYSFKYTVRYYDNYRHMKFSIYKDAIETYKPDILVIHMHTAYIKNLLNLYSNKYSDINN